MLQGVQGRKEVQLFLDDPNTSVLCVREMRDGGFRFDNRLGPQEETEGTRDQGEFGSKGILYY